MAEFPAVLVRVLTRVLQWFHPLRSRSACSTGYGTPAADGGLAPIPGTVVGYNPTGSVNLDIAVSRDGRYLFSLNAGTGTVGVFAIRGSDGSLTNLGTVAGLRANAGLNGIAAN